MQKTNKGNRTLTILGIVMAICCLLSGCGKKKVEIALMEDNITLFTESSVQLNISVVTEGADISDADVKWESQDTTIAVVSDDGMVRGVNPGNVIITATSTGNAVSCFVKVEEPKVYDSLPFNEKSIVDAIVDSSMNFYNPSSISVKEVRAATLIRIAAMNQLGGYAEGYYETMGRLSEISKDAFFKGIECPNISVELINAALDEKIG